MSEKTYIGYNCASLIVGERFNSISKVEINVTDETYVEAGNESGRTLTIDCPWGTKAMAQNILNSLSGYQYQPYEAEGVLLNPAVEIGDGITIGDIYSAVYNVTTYFDAQLYADVSAPYEEEIDHEYPYISPQEREIERRISETEAQFAVQANAINAKVSKTGGSQSFGWTLTEDGFILASNGNEVFRANQNGITVKGRIEATSGFIGSGTNGFNITSNAIYKGTSSMKDELNNGVYIGTDGISLGGGKFKVDSQGNLTASSGTFDGAVKAKNITSGGSSGYISGGSIASGSVGSGILDYGVNQSLGFANFANSVFNGYAVAPNLKTEQLTITNNLLWLNGTAYKIRVVPVVDTLGKFHTVLGLT